MLMLGLAGFAGLRSDGSTVQKRADYIDPAFHFAVSGFAHNLDSWAMPGQLMAGLG